MGQVENVGAGTFLLHDMGFEIVDWHPQTDGRGKPTQVHMLLRTGDAPGDPTIVIRLKSRTGYENFVRDLKAHADRVWPLE